MDRSSSTSCSRSHKNFPITLIAIGTKERRSTRVGVDEATAGRGDSGGGWKREGKGWDTLETSECHVRGASDCQFIVRIIARNRAAVIRRPCNARSELRCVSIIDALPDLLE